jgi:hypothetical protein
MIWIVSVLFIHNRESYWDAQLLTDVRSSTKRSCEGYKLRQRKDLAKATNSGVTIHVSVHTEH